MFIKCRSELAGIEGIVKLKHLDDSTVNISIDTTDSSDPLSPKLRLAQKNATLPFDAKLGNGNGFQDNELKRCVNKCMENICFFFNVNYSYKILIM